ncbi:hypothetical protein Phum_PHUM550440 [Pediculus humanus corporis]|uniref:Uncharacterized protein n=1 Tax=Pediculus humanus subsp. corporis TaxID=121224 RepID=E0W0D8_PEDHC|nr:uncharacterized protein Phum_PHUM550440 [Pediculus humanus corporis]EEB19094.1 hypothetical protein Phum_PHUM550440 [Pediculus humanus corporis]
MTIIEKGPSKVQSPSSNESRSGFIKSELRRELRSPDMKEKSSRRDGDLISTATSALRRLHFRSAGGSRPKRVFIYCINRFHHRVYKQKKELKIIRVQNIL